MIDSEHKQISSDKPPQQALWDKYWRSGAARYTTHHEIVERVERSVGPGGVVLEIGAGLGVDILEVSANGYNAVALDISKEALRNIRSRIEGRDSNISLVAADAFHLPFKSGSLDLIFHQGVMEHFTDPMPFLSEQKRALKTDGVLIADVPQTFTFYTLRKKWAIAREKWFAGWETQYTPGALERKLASAGFDVAEAYGRDYDIPLIRYISRIEKIGLNRFGRPVVPWIIRRPIGWACGLFEKTRLSLYFRQCIGVVGIKRR
jgi:SAM-dependent methyltransferase